MAAFALAVVGWVMALWFFCMWLWVYGDWASAISREKQLRARLTMVESRETEFRRRVKETSDEVCDNLRVVNGG